MNKLIEKLGVEEAQRITHNVADLAGTEAETQKKFACDEDGEQVAKDNSNDVLKYREIIAELWDIYKSKGKTP